MKPGEKRGQEKKASRLHAKDVRDDGKPTSLLLLAGLLGSLGGLASLGRLINLLDNADSDGLTHVTNGEAAKRGVLLERLDAHGLGGDHVDEGGITRLDELGVVLNGLAGSAVDLLGDLGELASNVGGVAVEDGGVAVADLTGVVHDDNLGEERGGLHGGVVLGVGADVATADVLDGDVLDVEADVVTGETLAEGLVVHLDGLDLGGDVGGGKGDDHAALDDTSLDTADGHSTDTADLVDILEGETKGLVGGTGGGLDGVDGVKEGLTSGLAGLGLTLPSLVPGHLLGGLDHVVTVPAGDGDEGNGLGVVADLLDEVGGLLDDFVESVLGVLGGVHLVDGDDELTNTEGERKESVLTGLAILGDTSLELTSTTGDDKDGAVGLRGTSDHVLDEVTVTRGVNDGDHVLGGLELPEGNVDGDTTLTLGLELVKNPSVLEGTLTELGSLLLELLDSSLVDTTALVDKVTGGGRLTGVDVSDDDDVNLLGDCRQNMFMRALARF